jgi:hypothetical protein
VDFECSVFRVLGRSRDWEWDQLPNDALPRHERYRDVLDPHDNWPVFPSLHALTLYKQAETVVDDQNRLEAESREDAVIDAHLSGRKRKSSEE